MIDYRKVLGVFILILYLGVICLYANQNSEVLLKEGKDCAAKGQLDEAIIKFDEVIRSEPQSADAYYFRGLAYYYKKDYPKAISDFTESSKFYFSLSEPALQESRDFVKSLSEQGSGEVKAKEGLPQRMIDARQALSQEANSYYWRGCAYGNQGNFENAIADCSKAIEINNRHFEAYKKRGDAYYEIGNYEQSLFDYGEAIKIKPEAESYHKRGAIFYGKGDLERAISDFNSAIQIDSQYAASYIMRSSIYLDKGDYDRGQADALKAESLGVKIPSKLLEKLEKAKH